MSDNSVKAVPTQKATASDVAELAGVSKWTVLRAFKNGASISPEAREQVMLAADKLGFRPNLLARGLKQRKTNIVGVVVDEFNNPHTLKMLQEATRQLHQRGYMALLLNVDSGENYQSVMQMAGQMQVDGLLFIANIASDELIVTAEKLHHIPSIHICRSTDKADVEIVTCDGYSAGKQLGQLLLTQGYQRFGYLKGLSGPSTELMRLEGYVASLEEAGQTLHKVLEAGKYDRDLAYSVTLAYLKKTRGAERIDALFCENDVLAFGAMQAIRDFGQGTHIGVVGFDDVAEANFPAWHLTTWAQRSDLQIEEALNRLLENRSDENGAWRHGELRLRHSHLGKGVLPDIAKCGCASRH